MTKFRKGMTDVELRVWVETDPDNGSYANTICRNCGGFTTDARANASTAKMVDNCKFCFVDVQPTSVESVK